MAGRAGKRARNEREGAQEGARSEPGGGTVTASERSERAAGRSPAEPVACGRPRAGTARLDERMVELGLESTRSRAQALIRAGRVWLGGRRLDKPGTLVAADAIPTLSEKQRYVSRGGEKLAGALDALEVDPAGRRCADVGVSTGGFTDCLLQRGARSVFALDVGYGQTALALRNDARVELRERTNVRGFRRPPGVPGYELVTADLSFISLRLVLPDLAALAEPGGRLLLLVKPQFELHPRDVKRGVVRDPARIEQAVAAVRERALELGLVPLGGCPSVLPGPRGNREQFLLVAKTPDVAG